MCGITGYFLPFEYQNHPAQILAKGGLLNHRGPDSFGNWISANKKLSLQHYRLSILDLTDAGNQPMFSHDKRFTIVFNGEIYNHLDLRADIESEAGKIQWVGHSDTETILMCFCLWGVEKSLSKFVGMFAIALFDNKQNSLTLIRDRAGEKPLYFGWVSSAFCFSSEIKVFKKIKSDLEIDHSALSSFFNYGFVAGFQSIYKDIFRLNPGTLLTISEDDVLVKRIPKSFSFWNPYKLTNNRSSNRSSEIKIENVVDDLDQLLRNSVKSQLLSDVPIGVLLSGGIDSSLIASIAQSISSEPINTFSVGFNDGSFDEAPFAKKIASHIGSNHKELYINEQNLLDCIKSLPKIFCEPLSDSSQIPSLILSDFVSKHVKVALGGEGGDELFGGYDRYHRVVWANNYLGVIPFKFRELLVPHLRHGINLLQQLKILELPESKVSKLVDFFSHENPSRLNSKLMNVWDSNELLKSPSSFRSIYTNTLPKAPSLIEQMMLADFVCYLPDDLLFKVDRSSMAFGLELRSPFLDVNFVEYVLTLDKKFKVGPGTKKYALKKLLRRYIPEHLFERPKRGFGLPLGNYLRTSLRSWAEELLSYEALSKSGLIQVNLIRKYWLEHLEGSQNWEYRLWNVLMFQVWYLNEDDEFHEA